MATLDPEQKRKAIETAVKLGVIGIGCAIIGPFAYLALEGLIAIAAFCAGALLLWGLAPAVATFVANKRIELLVKAIEANPIETMQNLYVDKQSELNHQASAITDFATEFGNVSDLVDDLKKSDPDEAVQYAEMRDKMKEGLLELRAEATAAAGELASFKTQIDKARRIYKVAGAMNKALEKSQSAQAQVFEDIKKQVSFDKVRSDLNRAFANLDSAVARRKNTTAFGTAKAPLAIPEAKPDVTIIDLTHTKAGERVSIRG